MDTPPFVPPHPTPRTHMPTRMEIVRAAMRNPLELWGEPSYSKPYVRAKFLADRILIANHPELVRHVLIDNVKNYRMARVRQLVLKPILRDGLLTAEGEVWKRTRKAMAPMFTPRHIKGFADMMEARIAIFLDRFREHDGEVRDIAHDMTELTYQVLSTTLFSDELAQDEVDLAGDVDRLLSTMGQVDVLDLMKAPEWLPRFGRMRGRGVLRKFRSLVERTIESRKTRMKEDPDSIPDDFLKLLMNAEGPEGLTADEVADNLITFIGAGHETTARALGWTLYCLSNSPHDLALVQEEIATVLADNPPPVEWLDLMPKTRAAFEEAMRLYPPAPSMNREAIETETFTFKDGEQIVIEAGTSITILQWVLHRHRLFWDEPNAYRPSRFWPENRDSIDRFQYLPFGAGPRICIGATFALQEAVIALALMLNEFRFEPTPGLNPWPVQKLTVQANNGLPMRVVRRQPVS